MAIENTIQKFYSDFDPNKKQNACPFCNSHDAFTIWKARNIFKCFSCGKAGTEIKFVMEIFNCSYQEALKKLNSNNIQPIITEKKEKKQPIYYTKYDIQDTQKNNVISNNLTIYLKKYIEIELLKKIYKDYYIGATLDNGIVFWQIDENYRIHKGKVMYYGADGHRIKFTDKDGKQHGKVSSMRVKLNRNEDFEPEMCYFGQHLISVHRDKPTAIVESEKTAIIASAVFPEFNWLATTSKVNFNSRRMNFLKNTQNNIIVYPDFDAYEDWNKTVSFLKDCGFKITISTIIKRYGKGKEDLADILLKIK